MERPIYPDQGLSHRRLGVQFYSELTQRYEHMVVSHQPFGPFRPFGPFGPFGFHGTYIKDIYWELMGYMIYTDTYVYI